MRVIVTRPLQQAEAWVRSLRDGGSDAVALPLIGIEPAADAAALRTAWHSIDDFAMLMFVSANAVAHFMAQRPLGAAWPAQVLAGSTGPGTSAALREAGVPSGSLVEPCGEPFDTESLWQLLCDREWCGRRVLVLRGQDGRDWLARQLTAAGAQVSFITAYRRTLPVLDAAQRALLREARAAPASCLWLFSSSQAIHNLQSMAADADWSASRAWASHARIAATARAVGFGQVGDAAASLPMLLAQLHAASQRSIQSGAS